MSEQVQATSYVSRVKTRATRVCWWVFWWNAMTHYCAILWNSMKSLFSGENRRPLGANHLGNVLNGWTGTYSKWIRLTGSRSLLWRLFRSLQVVSKGWITFAGSLLGNFLTRSFRSAYWNDNLLSETLDWRHVCGANWAFASTCSQHYYRAYLENVGKATCTGEKIRANERREVVRNNENIGRRRSAIFGSRESLSRNCAPIRKLADPVINSPSCWRLTSPIHTRDFEKAGWRWFGGQPQRMVAIFSLPM